MASESAAKRPVEKEKEKEKDAAPAAAAEAPLFDPMGDLKPRARWFFGVLILLANIPLIHYFFRHTLQEMPVTTTVPFTDNFERADVGPNYWNTGGFWTIFDGELKSPGVKNNPDWLQADLPDNVAIEFDTKAGTSEADIRFEAFGDGFNHDSGYTFLLGGYGNRITAIAKLNERGPSFNAEGIGMGGKEPEEMALANRSLSELQGNGTLGPNGDFRIERTDFRVQPGAVYHVRIEAKDQTITWLINGNRVLQLTDKYRLKGKDHNRFGFSSWDSDVYFDNLSIQPL